MEHELIPAGEIHAPHNWVVADEAARLALVVTEADLGKYCWQRDNESQWFLRAHDPAAWQPMETTVAWGDIADKPDLIEEGDSRLTDSRTPTGGAGGVLSGSFPNPGFAADMATQGEMDTQVTLLYTALDDLDAAKIDATEKGAANGVATLGADQKIPESQLPSVAITDVFAVASQAAMLALTAERGDIAVRSDLNKTFALAALPASTLANWLELRTPTDAVLSVAGRTGAITLAKADVDLGNVDNTSDANKPVSTAQAAALTAHTGQSTGAHAASAVSNTPAGSIAATTVQAAINELDNEKASVAAVREKLTAARTYYVRSDGSDSNNGLADTSGGAFLTIQKAIDTVATLDLSIYGATIRVADATWAENVVLKPIVGSSVATIQGNTTTPGNCIIAPATGSCVSVGAGMLQEYILDGFRYNPGTSGFCVVSGSGTVRLRNFTVGAVSAGFAQIYAANRAVVTASSTSYTIAGGGGYHFQAVNGGCITANVSTVTVSGTPAFSSTFASASNTSLLVCISTTFSGSATGKRYELATNAVIQTAGAGASFFPGNVAGTNTDGTGAYA